MNKGISKLWIAEITGRVLTAVVAIYTARVIGVESYGMVGYVAAVASYFSVFVRFGTDSILVRDLSRNILSSSEEKDAFRAVAILIRLIFAICSVIVLLVIGLQAESQLLSRLYFANAFCMVGLLVPLDVLLQSEERFGAVAASRVFFNVSNLFLIFIFLNDSSIAWWIPLASGISMIVTQVVFIHTIHGKIMLPSVDQFKRLSLFLLKESIPVFISMTLLLLIGQLGIILVKIFSTAHELGLYVTGYKIYDIVNAMIVPISTTLFPKLSQIWSSDNKTIRTTTLVEGIKIALPLALLAGGVSLLCGKELLSLFFGERFSGSDVYLSILLLTLAFRSISMFFANAFIAGGRQKYYLAVTAIMVFINLLLSYALIKNYGAYGAAWSNLFAYAIELIGFSIAIRTMIHGKQIVKISIFLILIWMIAYSAGWLFVSYLPISSIFSFLGAFIFSVIFLISLFKYKLNPYANVIR
jgi:O-antigen/teichoic acid export membrane protein